MFEKKEIIFSDVLGVCQVAELTRLPAKNGEQMLYYGLRSVYDKHKVSYIPVEHHQVLLRPLISYEEALKRSGQMQAEGKPGQTEGKLGQTEEKPDQIEEKPGQTEEKPDQTEEKSGQAEEKPDQTGKKSDQAEGKPDQVRDKLTEAEKQEIQYVLANRKP